VKRSGGGVLAVVRGPKPGGVQRLGAKGHAVLVEAISAGLDVPCRAEKRVEPLASIGRVAVKEPVPAQGTDDPHGGIHCFRMPSRHRPSQRLPDVVLVSLEPTNGSCLRGPLQVRRG
jgi:hypothetical protein